MKKFVVGVGKLALCTILRCPRGQGRRDELLAGETLPPKVLKVSITWRAMRTCLNEWGILNLFFGIVGHFWPSIHLRSIIVHLGQV